MSALAYAIITLGNSLLTGVMSGWLLYFYLPPAGEPLVPLALYSLVILLSRLIYLFAIIPIDNLSRRTRSSWGRNLPYIVAAGIFVPVLFALLWLPPHAGQTNMNLLYLFMLLTGFNLACAIQQTPYEGLLPELGFGEQERAAVANWRMAFLLLGNVLAGLAGPLIESFGFARATGLFAALAALCLVLPGLFLHRRLRRDVLPEPVSLAENIKASLNKPAFRVFALTWGLMWLATTFIFETLPYIATEICHLNKAETAYLYFAALAVSLFAYPVVMKLAERLGAKTVFRGSLLAGAVTMPGLLIIHESIPMPLLAQGILWMVLQAASLVGAQSLPGAITAEIDKTDSSALGNLVDQLASGLALALIPLFMLLGRSQADAQGPLGIRLLGLAGGVFLLAAFLVFGRYQIQQKENNLS